MTIHEITERDPLLIARLLGVWEASVRETHLFLSDGEVGRIKEYVPGAREVTVNEQNPQAVGFYRHMGFEAYKRTGLDEEGNPYPLLYMRLP